MSNQQTTTKPISKAFPASEDYEVQVTAPVPKKTFWGSVKDEPHVVIGAAGTAGVLGLGVYGMLAGNRQFSNQMMRLRVVAQGTTLILCGAGVLYSKMKGGNSSE